MASDEDKRMIRKVINDYIECLRKNDIKLWRLYLYGSHVRDMNLKYSDIDIAVFLDKDDIDGFEDDALLMKLTRGIDLRLEPHSFARTDFDETDPFIKEIITTGERIL